MRIMVAPTGARRSRTDHPTLPVMIAVIAEEAAACQAAGAEALNLHVRDAKGRHSLDPGLYREAIAAVTAAAPGMEFQITTESAGIYGPEDQLACLCELCPRWASLAPREVASDDPVVREILALVAAQGTRLQLILHRPCEVTLLRQWHEAGWLKMTTPEVIGVLGQYAPPRPAGPHEAQAFLTLSDRLRQSFCAFGAGEISALAHAAPHAEWLRVGFENNIHHPDGTLLAENAASECALRTAVTHSVLED